jgi:two-component system chemotaxis response regulator CheB
VTHARGLPRDIVAIGASAGGIEAMTQLFSGLPADFPATIAVVLHRSPLFESRLPQVLGRRSRLSVLEPADGDAVKGGLIYVAPRDLHMVFEDGRVRLDRGPKEHRTRPAIDPLFRSAALAYGPRVVGVLLSGGGDDGSSGLIDIKAAGGVSLVQDPREARHGTMPGHAICADDVDAVLTIDALARWLQRLAAGDSVDALATRTGAA